MDPVYETNSQFAFTQKCTRDLQCGLHTMRPELKAVVDHIVYFVLSSFCL